MSAESLARLTIDMDPKDHKRLKALAVLSGKSMRELVLSCISDYLLSEASPNQETLQAFKETDKGEGLVTCKDVDDLMEKLDL